MVVLIDTNIILDHLCSRKPFMDTAGTLFQYCFQNRCIGYVAAHSITNIFYILRKQFSTEERRKMLLGLCDFIEIAGIEKQQLVEALTNEVFEDMEDSLQVECAKAAGVDYIITRDMDDFTGSPIPAILPEDFLKKLGKH
jgi:predicted nucleic acid-binding protein